MAHTSVNGASNTNTTQHTAHSTQHIPYSTHSDSTQHKVQHNAGNACALVHDSTLSSTPNAHPSLPSPSHRSTTSKTVINWQAVSETRFALHSVIHVPLTMFQLILQTTVVQQLYPSRSNKPRTTRLQHSRFHEPMLSNIHPTDKCPKNAEIIHRYPVTGYPETRNVPFIHKIPFHRFVPSSPQDQSRPTPSST